MADQGWQCRFEEPILLPSGRRLHTLREAADYITTLSEEESDLAHWQIAIEALKLVARSGPTMLARIAFMKAPNHNVVLRFNPDASKHHWGKRKLKRGE